jgi:hypothetical protein
MNDTTESSKCYRTPTVIVLLLTETVLVELLKVLTALMVYSPAGTVGGMVHTGEIFSDMVTALSTRREWTTSPLHLVLSVQNILSEKCCDPFGI